MTTRVSSSDSACPPMMTFARDAREAAPGPFPSARGIIAEIRVMLVIRIGRSRAAFASRIACSRGIPPARKVFV